jgi:hypothetical protein
LTLRATDDDQELVRLENDWMRAVQARDMHFLDDLLGEEFALTTGRPGAEIRGRQEWLANTRERYIVEAFEFESLAVHVYGVRLWCALGIRKRVGWTTRTAARYS